MTPAGKSAIGQVVGNGRRGDVKIHIFAINTNPVTYTAMFTQDNSKVKLDSNGLAAVTLSFVCLRCYTNNTVEWVASYANDIHIRGLSAGVKKIKTF